MNPDSANPPLRIAMLGYAHTAHADSYSSALGQMDGVELAGVYDHDAERGLAHAREFHAPFTADLNELLERRDIQGVMVCAETDRHRELVCLAAQAGKHVLCEKPIATNLADARQMIDACRAAGVLLQIAFVCRVYPPVLAARKWVQAGELGQILGAIGGNRGRPPLPPMYPDWITDPRQAGGGALLDHSVHVTDAMRFILDREVERVFAEKSRFHEMGLKVEDCGLISLTFQDGIIATVDPSWSIPENNPYHYDFYLRILGEKGTLSLDDTRQAMTVVSDLPGARAVNSEPFGIDIDTEIIRLFIRSIQSSQHLFPAASGEDGLRALEIALAAYQSAEVHQPVALPLAEEDL